MCPTLNRFPGGIGGRRRKILDGGDGHNARAHDAFESPARRTGAPRPAALNDPIQESGAAFGKGSRKRMPAMEIQPFVAG